MSSGEGSDRIASSCVSEFIRLEGQLHGQLHDARIGGATDTSEARGRYCERCYGGSACCNTGVERIRVIERIEDLATQLEANPFS